MPARLHRRQFLLGPKPIHVTDEWKVDSVAPGRFLSYDPDLPVTRVTGPDGATWRLLGLAVQADPERGHPEAVLRGMPRADVADATRSWAGRWLLIGETCIVPDAAALLSCFYARAGGESWVSSSTVLLADRLGERSDGRDDFKLRQGNLDWVPPPATAHPDIRRLLPSQLLLVPDLAVERRQLITARLDGAPYEEQLDRLRALLTTAVERACEGRADVRVPLSAGYDSRLVLALALGACEGVATYTMRKVNEWRVLDADVPQTSFTSRADMRLPQEIAEVAGVPHDWIEKGPLDRRALEAFDVHSGGGTRENDRTYVAHGQWSWCAPDTLILRGGAFEVGHAAYYDTLPPGTPPERVPDPAEILAALDAPLDTVHADGMRAWAEWANDGLEEGIDWRDRFYIEQRLAGWLASLEQALDLVGGERFYAVNSSWTYGVLLSIPEEVRGELQHHVDMVERLAPRLAALPFNPPDPPFRKLWIKVLRKAHGAWRRVFPRP